MGFFLKDLNSNKHFDFDHKLVTIKLSSTEIKLQLQSTMCFSEFSDAPFKKGPLYQHDLA